MCLTNMATDKQLDDPSISAVHHAQMLVVTSLEHGIWNELKAKIALSLSRLNLEPLYEPTIYLLHQLVINATQALHYNVFQRIVNDDFGISTTDNHSEFELLYKDELAEHGDRNIARFCEENGLRIILSFPNEGDILVTISAPIICKDMVCLNDKLIDALGYQFQKHAIAINSTVCVATIRKHKAKQFLIKLPTLLTTQNEQLSSQGIFTQLGYSIVCFSSVGTIFTISPAILAKLHMEETVASIEVFAQLIPTHFYNDVIWGMALETPKGVFENYRVRIRTLKDTDVSVLFNVSGYRDGDSVIHTLWQAISLNGKENNRLSEGSILNEARVHNITRNYVPQLVEQKAREVVRLGGTQLINEECFIAVMFCDIVGFTAYVEKHESEESVIHTLNSVLSKISKSVKNRGGFIDKFMGDCVMALFRNPHEAVIAALEMQHHSMDINHIRERAQQDALPLRIGIDWGKVIIGNIGTSERLDWTAIGDVVNTASRIEKNCQPGAVLISERMRNEIIAEAGNAIQYGNIFSINVKGKRSEIAVCYIHDSQLRLTDSH